MKFESRTTGEVLYVADSQAKTIRHMIMSGRYKVVGDAEWKESDHPRGANGQFGSGGGSSGGDKGSAKGEFKKLVSSFILKETAGKERTEKANKLAKEAGYDSMDAAYKDMKSDILFDAFKQEYPMGVSPSRAEKLHDKAYGLWQETKDERFSELANHYKELAKGK